MNSATVHLFQLKDNADIQIISRWKNQCTILKVGELFDYYSYYNISLLTPFSRSVDFSTFFCYAVCAVLCSALHQCNDFNHLLYI